MINELYELAQSLQHHGLLMSTTNPNVGKVRKCQCLLIELDGKGKPVSMRLLPKEETALLWRHSKGNHNSFPAIRVQLPLLDSTESQKIDGDIWKKFKLPKKQELLRELELSHPNPNSRDIKLSEWSLNELSPVLTDDQPALEALRRLVKRFPNDLHCSDFYSSLLDFLFNAIDYCDNDVIVDCIKEILVGKYDAKKRKYISECMTYFDVYETNEVQCKVVSAETSEALIRLLNKSAQCEEGTSQQKICALSGKQEQIVDDKFPYPKLPLLGLTYLYSKNANIPCLKRYNMRGTDAFQVSKSKVSAINDALAFLTAPEREDKSWRSIVNSNRDKPDLLLAYLTDDPQNDALLAQILDDLTDYTETEFAFDALCKQVLGKISSVLSKNPASKINLIILETLDPGRKQIVFGSSLSVEQFQNNLLSWNEASKNHPDISIRIREEKKIKEYNPICPGPGEICSLLKMHYTRSGTSKPQKASEVTLHDVYHMYMPQTPTYINNSDFLQGMLYTTLRRTSAMLGDIGQQINMEYVLHSLKTQEAKKACIAISFISILLWHLGAKKEDYMLDVPFNIGQFLQLADMLHKEYCIQVRNGGNKSKMLPTQLMGNELLTITSESPNEGMNRLRERMRIYLAWANTATGEGSGLAKWILTQYGEVCSKIGGKEIPETLDSAQQAQVLLGYLATIPYERKEGEKK
ncbi:MAG: hypothetical protein WDZ91_16475 [Paenibacillaceae bacterium]